MHRVKQNAQSAFSYRFPVKHRKNVIYKIIEGRVHICNKSALLCRIFGERGNIVLHSLLDKLLQASSSLKRCVAPLVYYQLHSVISRGVVRCGNLNAVMQPHMLNQKHDKRCRSATLHKYRFKPHSCKHFCYPKHRGLGKEASVIPDNDRLIRLLLFLCEKTDSIGHSLYILFDKIVTYYAAPTACAKFNRRSCIVIFIHLNTLLFCIFYIELFFLLFLFQQNRSASDGNRRCHHRNTDIASAS